MILKLEMRFVKKFEKLQKKLFFHSPKYKVIANVAFYKDGTLLPIKKKSKIFAIMKIMKIIFRICRILIFIFYLISYVCDIM